MDAGVGAEAGAGAPLPRVATQRDRRAEAAVATSLSLCLTCDPKKFFRTFATAFPQPDCWRSSTDSCSSPSFGQSAGRANGDVMD